ncbi:monooxygenase 2-like [Cucurbita maxima]|uniref:Monooxygenase 2-like n=1 Tax=Cucurbita maxima TaxID=3661 RepID=A0A6J1I133_CUCMA|nr:monooxygenase 2-like [Cucurbita maxima]
MENVVDVLIVGAGISGLTTALGFHRLGIRSLVLESSDDLRITGFALSLWTNGWKALDAVGIGDSLRQIHDQLEGIMTTSMISGRKTSELLFSAPVESGVRCVRRKFLLEFLAKELPIGTIKFSSKVVSIEESGLLKLVHLADGTSIKTKVLIGCDGVNSVVAKWLGFKAPAFTGRYAVRGCLELKSSHGFEPKMSQFVGEGVRAGIIPCNDKTLYWFFTWTPSAEELEMSENPAKLKQLVLSKLGEMPGEARAVIEETDVACFQPAALRYRPPWELMWGNIVKGNVCVAGDALHPMTPDLGQGGCSALEDGVVLARCIAEALLKKPSSHEEEVLLLEMGLRKYAAERKWRSIDLISTAYMVGRLQQSSGAFAKFFRDKILSQFLVGLLLGRTNFDCGKLAPSSL